MGGRFELEATPSAPRSLDGLAGGLQHGLDFLVLPRFDNISDVDLDNRAVPVLRELDEIPQRAIAQDVGRLLHVCGELIAVTLDVLSPGSGQELTRSLANESDTRVTCSCNSTGTRIVVVLIQCLAFGNVLGR